MDPLMTPNVINGPGRPNGRAGVTNGSLMTAGHQWVI